MMNKNKQLGMTLITSLTMLLVMTIIGITALKISSLDLLISNNYQKQLHVYQAAESKVQQDANLFNLYRWIETNENTSGDERKNIRVDAIIIDTEQQYPCLPNGLATSIGPDNTPCHIFMFQVNASMKSSGAKALHYQGVGKLMPNVSKASYLD